MKRRTVLAGAGLTLTSAVAGCLAGGNEPADDGTTLIDKTREQRPGAEVEFGRTARVGTHELRVTVAEGGTVAEELTGTVSVTQTRFSTLVVVDGDGVSVTGAVAELGICQYDD
jgi:hypothetical protein